MSKPLHVAGDLEKHGWVVCTGCQGTKSRKSEKQELHEELMNFIYSNAAKDWRMPQKNILVRTIDNNPHSSGNIKKITELYDHMLCDCLHKIPLFEKL